MHVVRSQSIVGTARNSLAFHYNSISLRVSCWARASLRSGRSLADVLAEFNAKRVVLTVTAGRTGTDTISRIFGLLPDTDSRHEPNPNHRFILAKAQHNPTLAANFFWHLQAPSIVARRGTGVLESSHLFCKGFFEPCIAAGFRPSILLMQRDARATALSHYRKNSVPGRTGAGYRYLIAPTDRPYLRVKNLESLSDYQRCYWYCLEMEHRQKLYSEVAADLGMRVAAIETGQLNDLEKLTTVCEELGLMNAAAARSSLVNAELGVVHNGSRESGQFRSADELDFEETRLRELLYEPSTVKDVYMRIDEARRFL